MMKLKNTKSARLKEFSTYVKKAVYWRKSWEQAGKKKFSYRNKRIVARIF